MGAQPTQSIRVFLSCAGEDRQFLEELLLSFSGLMREGMVQCHHRYQVRPGSEWREVARRNLRLAEIILLLVSPSFVASDSIYGEEATFAMKQSGRGVVRVIPILVRPVVGWENLVFGGLKSLPEGEAVSMWSNREDAFASIVRGVRDTIDELRSRVQHIVHERPLLLWNVPYWQNPFFTGREEVLATLQKAFASSQLPRTPQALSGLAGVGKTQVAVEYAYRHAADYQAVLWVHADAPETLLASFVDLAAILELPEKDETSQPLIVKAVKNWLQQNTRWLLIVDNVEDVGLLQDIVPAPHAGHILVTTRSHRTGRIAHRVDLRPMSLDDGALLLLRRAKLLVPQADLSDAVSGDLVLAREIARETESLPLALDQAGAYMEETGRGLADYAVLYQQYSAKLLKRRGAAGPDHPSSVTTTFALALEKVKALNEAALELLELCAFLQPDAIPEDLLVRAAAALRSALQMAVTDPIEFDRAIEDLLKFSLVQRESVSNMLSIHRLVQVVVRDTLTQEQRQEGIERVVRLMDVAFPSDKFANWPLCQRYLSQAQACAKLVQQAQVLLPEAAQFLCRAGAYLSKRGLYDDAELLLTQALSIGETLFGSEHLRILPALNELARVSYKKGHYTLAEPLILRAIALEEAAPEENAKTATILNTLARIYHKQGRYNEAEPLLQRSLALRQRLLGSQHPDVASSLNNLGNLCTRQGKYGLAEDFYQQALAIKQQVLEPQNPAIASSLDNLAKLYISQGKYEEAEALSEQALKIYEQALGLEHPDVLLTLGTLAAIYREQEKYAEAEQLYKRIFPLVEKSLGKEHPSLVRYYNGLSTLYLRQGKYVEAEDAARQALRLGEKVLGPEHPSVAMSLDEIADIYKAQNRYAEAEELYAQALALREKALGPDHVHTLQTMDSYADLLQLMGRDPEATELKARADTLRSGSITNEAESEGEGT